MPDSSAPAALSLHGHWVLRARPGDHEAVLAALGWPMPDRLLMSQTRGMRSTLWLGPDELMLIDEEMDSRQRQWPASDVSHSCVDVSARQVAFDLKGPKGAELLAAGCPLDLHPRSFPIGACTRTVLGKCEVIVWRRGEEHLRLECWRSFAPYLASFLEQS